jgi:hypothetical protein
MEQTSGQGQTHQSSFWLRIFGFSEGGCASAWSADIPVRSVPGLNTEADKNVRAPKKRRCALILGDTAHILPKSISLEAGARTLFSAPCPDVTPIFCGELRLTVPLSS